MPKPEKSLCINVVVGVLQDNRGQVLISQRLPSAHQAGAWEFPGGKIHEGETPLAALTRELAEELGIVIRTAAPRNRALDSMLITWCFTWSSILPNISKDSRLYSCFGFFCA